MEDPEKESWRPRHSPGGAEPDGTGGLGARKECVCVCMCVCVCVCGGQLQWVASVSRSKQEGQQGPGLDL